MSAPGPPPGEHTFLDHTADIAVELRAPDREGLYARALAAFTDAVTPLEGVEPRRRRVLEVDAPDAEELMVSWLEELLYVYEVDALLLSRAAVSIEEQGDHLHLTAIAWGEPQDPERHPTRVLLKGVTYHRLAVHRDGEGWFARVIFDI